MRKVHRLAAAALALPLLASTGGADDGWRATSAGWVSGPVEHVGTIAEEAGTAVSATLHRHRLYVTSFRSFSIYDVRDALAPRRLSTTPLAAQVFNEQPDTNGSILVLANDLSSVDAGIDPLRLRAVGSLEVWDVRDPAAPRHLASLPLAKREHIWTCVLDCEYAYGAGGSIVDLGDPSAPRIVADWTDGLPRRPTPSEVHAIQEVAPGVVLTGGAAVHLLDAREDPTRPAVRASVDPALTTPGSPSNPTSLPAHVGWPEATTGRWALVSMETPFGGDCDGTSGGFRTYDTTGWETSATFRFVDEYVLDDGVTERSATYADGRSAYHVWGCSAYVFDAAEHFTDTGRVAVAWFEDGLRLLEVGGDGTISEVGGFVPHGGSSATPIWRNDEVLYLVDIYRGVDILRVTADGSER